MFKKIKIIIGKILLVLNSFLLIAGMILIALNVRDGFIKNREITLVFAGALLLSIILLFVTYKIYKLARFLILPRQQEMSAENFETKVREFLNKNNQSAEGIKKFNNKIFKIGWLLFQVWFVIFIILILRDYSVFKISNLANNLAGIAMLIIDLLILNYFIRKIFDREFFDRPGFFVSSLIEVAINSKVKHVYCFSGSNETRLQKPLSKINIVFKTILYYFLEIMGLFVFLGGVDSFGRNEKNSLALGFIGMSTGVLIFFGGFINHWRIKVYRKPELIFQLLKRQKMIKISLTFLLIVFLAIFAIGIILALMHNNWTGNMQPRR